MGGSTFDATTGLFNWTPSYTQSGPHTVSIKGIDRFGKESFATTYVNVINDNFVPQWVARLPENVTVREGDEMRFQFFASDDDVLRPVTYTLVSLVTCAFWCVCACLCMCVCVCVCIYVYIYLQE